MSGGVAGGVLPEKLGGGLWPTSFPGSFPCQGKDPGNEVDRHLQSARGSFLSGTYRIELWVNFSSIIEQITSKVK